MSACFPVKIEIGGLLTRSALRQIAELACQAGMSCDCEQNYDPEWIEQNLLAQLKAGKKHLQVDDPEVYHDFEECLTDYLMAHGIPWNKRRAANYEYGACFTWWRPGMSQPEQWNMMDHSCQSVQVSLALLKQWLEQQNGLVWVIQNLKKIGPKMPPVTLVGESNVSENATGAESEDPVAPI